MKITRRLLALPLTFASLVCQFAAAQAQEKPAAPRRYLVYVGTYTTKTNSKGIYAYSYDAGTGKFKALGVAAETADPSFLAVHPSGKYLYAVNEIGEFNGEKSGAVSAFLIDRRTGKLKLLNQVASRGAGPCHISLDKTGNYILVANYDSGTVAVFPVQKDGQLGKYTGFAPNAGVKLKPGAGPRHAAFHPGGRFFYVTSELNSTVTVYSYDAKGGTLHELQVVSTLPKDFSGENDTAEIAVHPSGKFLYVSNRGRDSIAVFAIDPVKGKLTPVADIATQGKTPRNFAIDPTGKYLLAANQRSNDIVVFKIDPATGALTLTGQVIEVPSPVDIAFLPAE